MYDHVSYDIASMNNKTIKIKHSAEEESINVYSGINKYQVLINHNNSILRLILKSPFLANTLMINVILKKLQRTA